MDGIKSLDKYKIAETEHYFKKINSKKYNNVYQRIVRDVYPLLRSNPYFGGNIKKLKGEYKDIYRFRIGNYRLFYKIEESIIFFIDIESRQGAYK
jgi:mRNA interferase RelE/StbE